jgi:hypothetical protein
MYHRLAIAALSLLLVSGVAHGDDVTPEEDQGTETRDPKHRIDFGVEWFDAEEGRSATGYLNYSWVPHPSHALASTLLLVGSDFAETEGSGIGDLRVQYSWALGAGLTASPWVPNSLGMGFGLIIPTGDPAKGTGDDRWVAIPTFGWVVNIKQRFSLLPTLQYFITFNEGLEAQEFRAANLELGFVYVTKSEFWFNYTPSLFRDFRPVDDTNLDHTFIVGKQFKRGIGVSLTLGTVERGKIQQEQFQRESDYRAALTGHFVLPF